MTDEAWSTRGRRDPGVEPPTERLPPQGAADDPYAPRGYGREAYGFDPSVARQGQYGYNDAPPPPPPGYGDEMPPPRRRPPAAAPRRPRPPRRRPGRVVAWLLVAVLVLVVGGYFYLDSRLNRIDALPDYSGRPADTPGTNWLVVGSDSREGLDADDRRKLRTGNAAGRRTDSMMLLHYGDGGTTLVSLPRDSFVAIPGHGSNKLNAAYAFGGPKLLVRTVEQATGIRIDHYAEIGFGGFVGVVDAVGGVDMCLKQPLRDPKAGLNLRPGCQTLSGAEALGFVRTRKFANGDLERVQNQRRFFAALMDKATSPGVLFNPFRSIPLALNSTSNFTVDEGDHLLDLVRLMWAMRSLSGGDGVTTTVPVGGFGSSAAAGSFVRWDRAKSEALFEALREDEPVPSSVVRR
ncbi:LCP family protein required for cell wall assembly [Actinomadura cellulosilytica]|uniref:LCP family protein required for cell wall assembly n=2 Tax=Thermomonospora cellulosilytica TaxID=1411118 RepID=A0A7W3R9E9_9ACTN|nr:LCP family protein [Thermomonospora cellulosilytica]MBA9004682.1 LCP family protein required for cell wall assembly [Thermomonospora cellulosilytica]